ncbi:MAG: fimbrillin family protein, partial [Bacteroidaceae bacterium]|nr:fimbrillin family protein [Bacteroidaceae bacterium]
GDIAMLVQNGQSPTFEALFFPYNPTENPILTVNATIAGESRVMTCEITPKKSGFVSGKRYTLTVTINDTAITPTSETFTIDTKWEDGNEDEDFELDFGSDSENGDDVFITD